MYLTRFSYTPETWGETDMYNHLRIT